MYDARLNQKGLNKLLRVIVIAGCREDTRTEVSKRKIE